MIICSSTTPSLGGQPGFVRSGHGPVSNVGLMGCWVLLLLHACASSRPAAPETPGQAPLELPSHWAATLNEGELPGPPWPADPASSIWWFPFADPLLTELILQALAANTSIHGARAAVLQAQAQRDLAAAALWPQLDASASAQRGRAGGVSTGQRLQLGLDGRWQPDVFGATRSAVQAADATALASAASLVAVQLQLSTEVGLNYVLLRAAQARLRIAEDSLANQRETLEITDWREQAGLVSSQEAAQARTAAAQTAALLPSLRTSIARASHALAVLSGRPPAELLQALAPAGALPQLSPAAQASALNARIPAETLRQRADVQAAEYRIAAALAQLDRAQALQRWPSFSISGSLGLSAASLSGLGRSSAVLSSLLAGISLPVLDGGAARAEVSLQQAGLLQAQQQYRAAVLLALQEVEDALVALHGDRQRVASMQQASAAAVLAANLAQQRYRSGLVDFQAVLETQRSQLASPDGLASAGANGSLQPTRAINIGSELSGTVLRVLVDANDRVKKGQVLVELDTAKQRGQIQRSQAALQAAAARLDQVAATQDQATATLARLEEVARLSGGKVPDKSELDAARAGLARARADVASARAGVDDARAALATDRINLSKASISSPADGMVLSRSVEPGNAVAASLQAVTLFVIAEDLSRLRLWVYVDEADVGAVQLGQAASFTVSAYPARKFPARITRVGFGSTITDNVVTYLSYLDVDNRELSLRPGMTASATITATQRRDVLLVPNAALRFKPSAAGDAAASGKNVASRLLPSMPRGGTRRQAAAGASTATARHVWMLPGAAEPGQQGTKEEGRGVPQAVAVLPGISDGRMTEIIGGELKAGMRVITDQKKSSQAGS